MVGAIYNLAASPKCDHAILQRISTPQRGALRHERPKNGIVRDSKLLHWKWAIWSLYE